jgi:hypothetical protein
MARQIPKLNVASAEHPACVQIDSSEWSRIEDAYGSPISNAVRKEIQSLTNKFPEFGVLELNAPSVADAMHRTRALKKAASGLLQELGKGRTSEAVLEADRTIEKHLRLMGSGSADGFERVADMASCLVAACGKAVNELEDRKSIGLKDREHWQLWVYRLLATLKKHGLPAGIWKAREGTKDWPSAPVRLIKALQDCIPPEYRYRANSDEALSAAIVKARHEMRPAAGDRNVRRSNKRPGGRRHGTDKPSRH